ncbi:MAG: alpha/beta hydrolase, partial [Woeseiaceae bacterium]
PRPLDPTEPESPTLALKVAIVPALSLEPALDPFVPIAGGPGQSAVAFYAAYADAFEAVRKRRNILLLDQRGTGESASLDCDIDDEVIDGRFSIEQTLEETVNCLGRLEHDPRLFSTSVAVQDLEALRIVLGAPQLNLYGVSYGTRVAQHYLRRFPDTTRSVILDGVVPPQLPLGPDIALEAQRALESIFARCAESQPCRERFPSLANEFAALRERLSQTPVVLQLSHPLTAKTEELAFGAQELAGAIRLLSYHPSTVALIPLLIHEAARGNVGPLASQFLMLSERMADALSIGMHNTVVCAEDVPYIDPDRVDRGQLDATYIGSVQLDALEAICSVWPRGPVDDGFRAPVSSDRPVLLLSGEADPVTPPRYADLAAVRLRNARHLTGPRQGHGQAARGCMPEIIGRFVASASVDGLDADCYERVHAMPFFLDFSGPAP